MANNYDDNIDKIADDIKANFVVGSSTSHAKLEFTIMENEDTLVFEAENVEAKAETAEEKIAPKEITVPESFAPDGKYNTESKSATEPQKIWTTYVPRFTDASLKYKISDGKAASSVIHQTKNSREKTDEAEEDLTSASVVEPTVEIEEIVPPTEMTVVNVGVPTPEEFDAQSTVFKFDAPDEKPEETENVQEPSEPETSAPLEIEEDEAEEEFPEIDFTKDPKEYSIPDPVETENAETALVARSEGALPETLENIGDPLEARSKFSSEYDSVSGRDGFKDRFLDTIMSIKIRLLASVAVSAIILVLETLLLFGVNVAAFLGLSAVGGAYAVVEGILVSCLFVLSFTEVVGAFRALFSKKATPELFIPISYAVIMIYYATVFAKAPAAYSVFGTLFALLTLSSLFALLFKKSADFSAFKMISVNGEKKVVDKKLTRTLSDESLAVDGKVEGYKSKTARVFRTAFVADFFKRSGKTSENSTNVLIILGSALGISLVCALVSFFIIGGFISAISAFTAVFMLACPAMCILSHKIPFFHAQKLATSEKSAVIGECSLFDYSGVDVVSFRDTEVFGDDDVSLQRIMLYGKSENLTKALRQMSSLFAVAGGPLEHIFADSLDYRPSPAGDVVIEEDGITGKVARETVLAGSREFMERKGIEIPFDPTPDNATLMTTKVMYAAENGEIYAKFYVRYTLSEEFTMILPSLCDEGVTPLVYTRDPNVNAELFRALTAGSDSIRVLKKTTPPTNEDHLYQRVSAGIVTSGDKTNVINALLLCKKYTRFQSRIAVTELSSMIVGATLAVVLMLSGISVLPAIILGVWQAAWCAVLWFISGRTFNPGKDTTSEE